MPRALRRCVIAEHFDVVVLGGGPGGYAAALYGAAAGLRIALVEERRVGGTCLHQGCIPAKELLQTAEVLRTVGNAAEFGVSVGEPALDLGVSQERKQSVIERLTGGLETLLKGRKVTVVPGRGELIDADAHLVQVSDGTELRGDSVVLATGSAPRSIPGFEFDGERILSSDHVLEIIDVPGRIAIVGGGAIGCEFASLFGDLGSDVTVLEALPQILTGVDVDVAKVVQRSFKKRKIDVRTGVSVNGVEPGDDLVVRFEDTKGTDKLTVDTLVVSVGRRPRSENIGLEGTDVGVDAAGFIEIDEHQHTGVPGVYAVGDVVAGPALAHVAFAEAIVAVKTILGEPVVPLDRAQVPWGIYCHPEVAFSGLTEEQAREAGHDVVVSKHRFTGNSRALILGETDGLVKIVAQRDGPILGVHLTGPWATELLAEGYLAVNWEALPEEVASFVHPHPTLSELFGESAMALTGRGLHS